MTRLLLALFAGMFAAFGLWMATDPVAAAARLGVEAGGPSGVFELRGIYGGVSLGGALLCAAGALRASLERPALYFVAAYMGGYIIGRGASLAAGDSALASSWGFAAFEGVSFLLAVLALRVRRTA